MLYRRALLIVFCLLAAGTAVAQDATPTLTPIGPLVVPSATFTPQPTPTALPTPAGEDPRIAVCSAPFQPGFVPYRVHRHDRLADLLVGVPTQLTVTQLAALNCLDDPSALPVGGVIWLPPGSSGALAAVEAEDPSPGVDQATIFALTSSLDTVQNTAEVTFSWRAEGTRAYFYVCPPEPGLTCERPLNAQPVPLEYTTPPFGDFRYAGPMRYRLEVEDGADYTSKDILIEVVCTHEAIGEVAGFQSCPVEPIRYVFTAWQPFENGVMMWFQETRQIWVMTNDGRLEIFPDTYVEGEALPPASPPAERFAPVRGFGKVWAALGGAASSLGWATGEETGYDAGWQPAGNNSYTTYVGGPFGILYVVTTLPGSPDGFWHQIR